MKYMLSCLLAFSLYFCDGNQSHIRATNQEGAKYQIPEAGITAFFPRSPEITSTNLQSLSTDFENIRNYDCFQQHNESSTYFRHVGVSWSVAPLDSAALLEKGLKKIKEMIQEQGSTILFSEKFVYKGHLAYRVKSRFAGNQEAQIKPFFISIILFVRGQYLVDLAIFNASMQNEKWRDDTFFDSIEFCDITPIELAQRGELRGNCTKSFYCNFGDAQIAAQFPMAPCIKDYPKGENDYNASKYHIHDPEGDSTLFYGLEIYWQEKPSSNSMLTDALKLDLVLLWNKLIYRETTQEKVLYSKRVRFKGKDALETLIQVEVPKDAGQTEMITTKSLFFIHAGRIVNLFVYTKPDLVKNQKSTCFFDSVVFD
jgi:hypothetical protein